MPLLSDSWTGSPVLYDSSHAAATADTFKASDLETDSFSLPGTQTTPTVHTTIDTDDRISLHGVIDWLGLSRRLNFSVLWSKNGAF